MPMLTPTRIVLIAVSIFGFISFWFSASKDLGQPVIPVAGYGGKHAPSEHAEKPLTRPVAADASDIVTSVLDLIEGTPISSSISTSTRTTSDEPIRSSTVSETTQTSTSYLHDEEDKTNATAARTTVPPYPTAINATSQANRNTSIPVITCKSIPGASDVMVIVKTTKQESLSTQLDTLLSCVPNFAIFSDHAGMVRNYTIHDALTRVTNTRKSKHDEFKDYEKLRKQPDAKVGSLKRLDKWKMLPMVYEAYKMKPHMRFYLFIEPNTIVSWTNLLQWTARLDSRIPYYIGAPLQVGSLKFVQTGSGILLSNAAMQRFAKAYDERYESAWEEKVERGCCGDVALGSAMEDAHVELYNAFPTMYSDKPSSFEWSQKHWCIPIVTWQNVSRGVIEEAWEVEKNWTSKNGWKEPYLMRDAFAALVQSHLLERSDDWDNLSHDTKIVRPLLEGLGEEDIQEWHQIDEDLRQAVESWQACQKVCEAVQDCHQWRYSKRGEGECHLGKTIRLGVQAPKVQGEEGWTSGWVLDRIRNSTKEWECNEVKWPFQK
ncbi:uncharacterized protein EI97DRAFT_420272 [Westerdykella ornata]|uniref:Glycosyltransferase family 31 protein n=1 Tax=Westerdykella ornata TaxID=318751 RepID=A0A6A6JKB9_WESOR|nr:uncharacterized protein EI97DRAFT_420272 [Westerdykella ornata]KAF2275329.1 hypothetical protein EI97DRAFT_420272 [Westerdykella ornata]